MFLNVIIPSYNSAATIRETLESVMESAARFDGDCDVTVVDSTQYPPGIPNEVEKIVNSLRAGIRVILLPSRAYPGKARNEGVKNTCGDILCFTDSDARVDAGWLTAIRDYMRDNPDVDAVGGPVLNSNPNEGYSRLAHWCEFSGYGLHAPEGIRRVQPTVNVAVHREAFEKYGPFLEEQFGNEDVLLFNNMKVAKAKLHFSRKPIVYHHNKTKIAEIYKHQYNLGQSTGIARAGYNLPGSFLTRPGGSYLIPFVKTHFIGWRIITQEPDEYPAFLFEWPRVFNAMLYFARGFRDGTVQARK
jgi:glycosyltransferase involved in cell wall biosynthesis